MAGGVKTGVGEIEFWCAGAGNGLRAQHSKTPNRRPTHPIFTPKTGHMTEIMRMSAVWKESRNCLQSSNGSVGCAATKTTGKLAAIDFVSDRHRRCTGGREVNIDDRVASHVLPERLPEATPISATEELSFSMGQGR